MIDKDRLNRRVAGRDWAKEVLKSVDLPHPDCVDGFLDELTTALKPKETAEAKLAKLAHDRQFSQFASFKLSFGEHRGSSLENIPREYLEWLADSSRETLEMVDGYLEATADDVHHDE